METPTTEKELPREILMTVPVSDFETTLELFTARLSFRVDMIFPADSPSAAVISGHGVSIRLEKSKPPANVGGSDTGDAKWVKGRAGMEYRDLIPGRMGGKVIASHIRIPNGGEVADYVHYHKVDFQMIYCVAGSIKVVYEDQGPPFWLKPGDCVLQPPEIRHRVLEATAGAEVVEIGMPAVHETWADHDLKLPTAQVLPARDFGGQRFVHHIAANSDWIPGDFAGFESRDTGISAATMGFADVRVLRAVSDGILPSNDGKKRGFIFYFVLKGTVTKCLNGEIGAEFTAGDGVVAASDIEYNLRASKNSEILRVIVRQQ